jgi:catechol 2,3-dioxygenase-like lactoylglutathione lyase family enzyme
MQRVRSRPIAGVYESVLYGDDVPALAAFYQDVLGLRVVEGPDDLLAAIRLPDATMLLLFHRGLAARPDRLAPAHGTDGPGHIAFRINADDVDAWRETLRARHVAVERTIEWDDTRRSLYFRDPAGNSVELAGGELWAP